MKVTVQDLINLLSEMDPSWYVQVPSEECQDADGNQLYFWQDLTSEEVYSVDLYASALLICKHAHYS